MDEIIIKRLTEFVEKYKKLEDENNYDDAIQEVDNALLYITARLEGEMNFVDREVLKSYSRDYQIVNRTLKTNKRLSELEQRFDNISSQVGRVTRELEGKTEFK